MSKKNNKSIKARAHAHDIEREKLERERLAKLAEKNERKQQRREARAVAAGGVAKKGKKKGYRIRKGVQIKGIKVTDAESKAKLLHVLKAEQAAKMMDADGPGAAKGGKPKAKGKAAAGKDKDGKKGAGKAKVVSKAAKKAKAAVAAAAAAPAAMET
ncbi:MAG: hypothetical protein J3K34DRAFT_519867 [Monoraphidium minutum]|nr:MAG: hypothetical protein J3K34DRAFT_519867 [Monoraphidium minutum]